LLIRYPIELIGIVEEFPHSASPPSNARNPFLATPPSPTFYSPPNSPTTSTKKYSARYSFSSEDIELHPLSPAPRVAITGGRGQLHRQHTPRFLHSHRPHNNNYTPQRGNTSIPQNINASAGTTVTSSSSIISVASQPRDPIAIPDLERKKTSSTLSPSDSDPTTLSLPSNVHPPPANAPPFSAQPQSTTRQPQLPVASLPVEDESPPAYEDVS